MKKSQPLNIGLVFDDSLDSSDGVSQYVKTLGGWLSRQGHNVRYLVGETKLPDWDGGRIYSLSKNQAVFFNGNRLSVPLPANLKRIKSVLDKENFDVIHVMMPYSPFMAQRVIKQAAPRTAFVGTFHIVPAGKLARAGGRLLKLSYGRGLKDFSRVVSVSSAAQAYARRTFGIKSEVIPNPVDISKFSAAEPKKNTKPTIVFLGRLVKRKGCVQLLEAFAQLAIKEPDARLIIAGDGPLRKSLEAKSLKLDIADKVEFLGFISEEEKPRLLASASIACFPSLYGESFGIVLIEAMAAGAGVVLGGNNPGYSSVLSSQPLMLIDPLDTSGFALRLELLLGDKELAKRLHSWQLENVQQYDINLVGSRILDMYYQAIAPSVKNRHNGAHEL
jgi:phosphatidylinositol alpha-mannosyltransferase